MRDPLIQAAAVLAAAAAVLSGCGESAPRPSSPVLGTSVIEAPASPRATRAGRAARPVRVQIPSIGVDAPLISLGLDRTGALEVPARFDQVGWWAGGSRPGERGPAVIVGHVDSRTGPAVFFKLRALRRGDAVVVRRRDGTSVRFIVRSSERYPKDRFPTARVYGPTRRPELRLITCSGTFDRSTGHYLDNTVVYAAVSR